MLRSFSRFRFFAVAATSVSALLLLAGAPHAARAQTTLVQDTNVSTGISGFFGQSVTTPTGGPFNNLIFNFYDGTAAPFPLVTAAPGTLFLLTQAYTGTPAALSSSTPGYVASAIGAGGLYTFASSVTLQASTQYYFYSNTSAVLYLDAANTYAGGTGYLANTGSSNYSTPPFDVNFRLQGTVASAGPEPGTLPLIGMGLITGAGMVGTIKRRKAKKPAA